MDPNYSIPYYTSCVAWHHRASQGITGQLKVPEVPWEIACNPGKAFVRKWFSWWRWDPAFRKRMGHIKAWNDYLTFSFLPSLCITGSDVNQWASISPLCLSLICGLISLQHTYNFVLVLECWIKAFWIFKSVAESGKDVIFESLKISSLQALTPISENLPED